MDIWYAERVKLRRSSLRYLTLVIVACLLTGCAHDVVMLNPRTDETATCRKSLMGLNPWSQQEACIGDYMAQGWIRRN